MKNSSKVSVLMNCYNSEKYIQNSIQSLINQTFDEWELIVWDDASTDNTLSIAHSFNDKRIKIYKNDTHSGLGLSRVKAQEYLKGEYISILDSDDIYEKDKLKKQIQAFKENKNLSLVTSWYSIIDKKNKEMNKIRISNNLSEIKKKLYGDNIFAHSSIVYKRIEAEKVGWYSNKLEYSQDYDLTIKLLKNNSFFIVQEYLVKIRDSETSMTRNLSLQSVILNEHFKILNYIKNNFLLDINQKKINEENLRKVNCKMLLLDLQNKLSIKKIFNLMILLIKYPSLIVIIFKYLLLKIKYLLFKKWWTV